MAADGLLWDRVVARDDRAGEVLRDALTARDARDFLMTDDANCRPSDRPESDRAESDFVRIDCPEPSPTEEACSDADETHFAKLVDRFLEHFGRAAGGNAWLHSRFLTRRWDAPRDLFPIDDEMDAEPFDDESFQEDGPGDPAFTSAGETCEPIFSTVLPPQHRCDKADSVDLVMAQMRTYGCQVRLIDRILDRLIEVAEETESTLIVFGTSGFSLGQNGWIGHAIGPLRSCRIDLPLIVRPPDGSFQSGPIRWRDPVGSTEIKTIIRRASSVEMPLIDPVDWAGDGGQEYLPMIETRSNQAELCLTTPRWFFVRDADQTEHLHLKPDDRHDHNNVSRLRPDVIEHFDTIDASVG